MKSQSTFAGIFYFPLTRILVGFIVVVGAIGIVNFTVNLILTKTVTDATAHSIVQGILVAAAALASYYYLFKYYEKRQVDELSLNSFGKNATIGFLTGFGLQSLVILVIYLNSGYEVLHVNPVSFVLPGFAIALTSAIIEELIIRGIIFRIMEEKLGTVIAVVVSALIFGLLHLPNHGATLFSAASIAIQAGILLAAAYVYSRNLWLPIFLHFAWNFAEAGIYGVSISGNVVKKSLIQSNITGSEWITGGAFGPENSIHATLFCAVVGGVFLYFAKKRGNFLAPYWRK